MSRKTYKIEVSSEVARKVVSYLHSMLDDADMIRRYDYSFDLGKTINGNNIGSGDVCIRYYNDSGFARMQMWEQIIWEGGLSIASDAGEYDNPFEGWGFEDMACPVPLYADMDARRYASADMQTPPPPPSQQSSISRKLSKSRGTQPKATLDLRARLIQFLDGGGGGDFTCKPNSLPIDNGSYFQESLFDTSRYIY